MAQGYPLRRRSSDPILRRNFLETNNNSYSDLSSIRMRFPTELLTDMAVPIYTTPSREDVEVGGRVLFQHFIEEELVHQGIPGEILEIQNPPPGVFEEVDPDVIGGGDGMARAASPAFVIPPQGYKTASFTAIGANIRDIADKFAQSHERIEIQELASGVDLNSINYATFQHILGELFRGGINKYKIVSLFYFCSDVLLRCIQHQLHQLGSKLFFWALEFLLKNICRWVQDHGGWERVFSNIFAVAYNVSLIAALGVVICCGFVYIKNNK